MATENSNIEVAATYQGGKTRLAAKIVDVMQPRGRFCDVACGSGAISIELVRRGHRPEDIAMIDKGPYGLFWEAVGRGSFSLARFLEHISDIPSDPTLIHDHLVELSRQPVDDDAVYVYLILQAGSFGGKAIWISDNQWKNTSFRSYWLPTETSNRRSPVNPMMPMPMTLYGRVARLCDAMIGIRGYCRDVLSFKGLNADVIYVDPPYEDTTGYGGMLRWQDVAALAQSGACVYVSEGKPLSGSATLIDEGRAKGGISGERKQINQEWLSLI